MAVRLVTITLIVAAAGIGYVALRADDFVTRRVIAGIEKSVPHWDVRVSDVRFDGAQARIFGLTIRPQAGGEDVVAIPEVVVTFDAEALASSQTFVPQHVQLRQPVFNVVRYADGSLNVDALKPFPESSGFTPLAEIDRATVLFRQAGQQHELRDLDLVLTPKAQGNYAVAGGGRLDAFGDVKLTGAVDVKRQDFDLEVGGRLRVDDRLVQSVASLHPKVGAKIAAIAKSGVQLASADPVGTVSDAGGPARAGLGLTAETDLTVQWKKPAGGPATWSAQTDIVRGELDNPLFPLPLRNLTGRIEFGSSGVQIKELSAANGSSGFAVAGTASMLPSGGTQKVFEVRATDVSLDGPLQRYLTPGLAAVHRLLQPHGQVDLVAKIDESGLQVTPWNLVSLVVRNGSFKCVQFPYPVTDVRGKAWHEGSDVMLEFTGRAGTRDVSITGRVIDAGPGAGFDILIETDGVPIDTQLRSAFETPLLAAVKTTAESLQLNGLLDGTVRVSRPPHVSKGTRPNYGVNVDLRSGSLKYAGLPYRLEDASGKIRFDDSKDSVWRFLDLSASRGPARITAEGTFRLSQKSRADFALSQTGVPESALLELVFQAADVPYDRAFYNAVTHAVPTLVPVLDELDPAGQLAASDIRVRWMPGHSPDVKLPELTLSDGRVRLKSFPYLWTDVKATIRRDPTAGNERVVFKELSARHNDTILTLRTDRRSDGKPGPADVSFAESLPGGWQVRLNSLEVRDLDVDQDLIVAVPQDFGAMLRDLNVRRSLNLACDMILNSTPQEPFKMAARGVVDLPGNDLTAGADLNGVRGRLKVSRFLAKTGSVEMRGEIDLAQLEAFDMAFSDVRGPIIYVDDAQNRGVLALGSSQMVKPQSDQQRLNVAENERLTASFYGGTFGLDLLSESRDDGVMAYDLAASIRDADLGLWAEDNGLGSYDLKGKMNGEAVLSGLSNDIRSLRGENGYLNISKARILRLPAMVQMLSVLGMRPPDDTAFRHAYFNFDVRDGFFEFPRIDLYGQNLSFVGRGRAFFRPADYGEIDFNFASYVPGNPVPLIGPLMEMLSKNWVYVKLGGSIGNPVTQVQTRLPLFDGLTNAMKAIEAGRAVAPRGR